VRFTEETRFPHPVLGPATGDYLSGEFVVALRAIENPKIGSLSLEYEITLTEPEIRDLVINGKAVIALSVWCQDTFYAELKALSWPSGRLDFSVGSLLNRVTIRPLVWLNESVPDWNPGTIHPEFCPPLLLEKGDVIALGEERVVSVGQAKLAPLESIFEIDSSPEIPENTLTVDISGDRIKIVVDPKTMESIQLLRGQNNGQRVVMNSIYLPTLMEVLDALTDSADEYVGLRWCDAVIAKCDMYGLDLSKKPSILESAQILLGNPIGLLAGVGGTA
jgi:hypothetical protein